MPFSVNRQSAECVICKSPSNILDPSTGRYVQRINFMGDPRVDCVQCGDFTATHELTDDWPGMGGQDPSKVATASHVIRMLQKGERRPTITRGALVSFLRDRTPPSPADAADSLILLAGDALSTRPGTWFEQYWRGIAAHTGLISVVDAVWLTKGVVSRKLVEMSSQTFENHAGNPLDMWMGRLTFAGWERYGELKLARAESNFAFFARKFVNPELDDVYTQCLRPAVRQTGYDLRIVTQRAGLIDAIIESEIRGCKFLVADLSDENPGAYWEAGLAEGLRKPVFYVCRALDGNGDEKKTHFDTAHRTTIRWRADPGTFAHTGDQLKAVIRNTLLGEAAQTDTV